MMEISLQTEVRERRSQTGSKYNKVSDMNGNISTKTLLIVGDVIGDAIVVLTILLRKSQ